MKFHTLRNTFCALLAIVGLTGFTACTVDQDAAWLTDPGASGSKTKTSTVETGPTKTFAERMAEAREEREKKAASDSASRKKAEPTMSFAERMEAARAEREKKAASDSASKKKAEPTVSFAARMEEARVEREKKSAAVAKKKAEELALKKKADAEKDRKLAAEKKAAEAEKKALAAKKIRDDSAAKKSREAEYAKKKQDEAAAREAKLAARKKADADRDARRLADASASSQRSSGGGFFSRMSSGSTSKYKSKGHDVYVNKMLIGSLTPSNAKIEVDLSDQKARIYKTGATGKQLVIETRVSSGKSGHSTPTGTYRINEKKVDKRSTLYGSWVSSSGSTVRSSGEAWSRPSGGSQFVGAEMPYWMRINGGIGMHIGYVPDYPASHGCIRVPSAVQPLIFSKVGVGTSVTIKY